MNSKRNKFVTYKLAKLLKKLGFNELTYYRVDKDDSLATNGMMVNWNEFDEFVSAPSLNELNDWLLENNKIFIEILFIQKNYDYGNKFTYDIVDITKSLFSGSIIISAKEDFPTKEAALNDAITKYVEKLIKNENNMNLNINENKLEIINE